MALAVLTVLNPFTASVAQPVDEERYSLGLGLRFMVLPAKRINIRVDFAWSTGSNAVHLSVGDAF